MPMCQPMRLAATLSLVLLALSGTSALPTAGGDDSAEAQTASSLKPALLRSLHEGARYVGSLFASAAPLLGVPASSQPLLNNECVQQPQLP